MKIIKTNSQYTIFPDSIETFDKFEPGTYLVNFSNTQGYFLTKKSDFISLEEKIYGNHKSKVNKVLNHYHQSERSLGVLLSGVKGSGKSLFVQLLSQKVISEGLPVFIVDTPYPGIANFLDSIEQECLVVFDEFEKNFKLDEEDGTDYQSQLLGLFDGLSQQKRLYAITANKIYSLSDFIVNRPGRFHYHLRFGYLTKVEVEEYLNDKLNETAMKEKQKVIDFSRATPLNYDCLRALCTELNFGESFTDALEDLNVINTEDIDYVLTVELNNGEKETLTSQLDLFSNVVVSRSYHHRFEISVNREYLYPEGEGFIADPSKVTIKWWDDDKETEIGVNSLTIVPKPENKYNFTAF